MVSSKTEEVSVLKDACRYSAIRRLLRLARGLLLQSQRHSLSAKDAKTSVPYDVHGKANILDDPYYNSNLTRDREDFSESDDLRSLKEGRVSVRWR